MLRMAVILTLAFFLAAPTIAGEKAPEKTAPPKEQEWLRQFVGEWESESKTAVEPGQPPVKCRGTMKSRLLGEYWVVSEIDGDMGGKRMTALQTLGYDSRSKKYTGTWVDSMLNHLWKYSGSVDETGKILTLEAEGPDFANPEKTALYRDSYEFKSNNLILMSSSVRGEDGKWTVFMTSNLRRKK